MRFQLCKINCPFICFCKPAPHIYTPGPLKLENAPSHVPASTTTTASVSHDLSARSNETSRCESIGGAELEKQEQGRQSNCLKSSLKRGPGADDTAVEPKEGRRKQVQWMDFVGKELVVVREFESSEAGESYKEAEGNRGCVCIIL